MKTVWHMYQQTTVSEGFVLMLGRERVELEATMEQLDYWREKKIMLRAVKEGSDEAAEKEISEGVVPREVEKEVEVIALD